MAQMMVLLISEQFTMTAEVTTELLVQISAYFSHTGIHNEEYLSFMINYVDWPPPQTINTPKKKDEPHLHSRHSPAIEDSKLHRSHIRRKTVFIPRNWILRTDYVVHQVQHNINGKSKKIYPDC